MGQILNKSKKDEDSNLKQKQLAIQKEIEELLDEKYCETLIKGIDNEADFYHAVYQVTEKLAKKKGAMQINLPPTADLKIAFEKYHHSTAGNRDLEPDEFKNIMKDLLTFNSLYVGQGVFDILMFLFGIPLSALLLKKFIPGTSSISDDIVIPVATSGAVFVLAKTHRL